jgi:hypothetical protein
MKGSFSLAMMALVLATPGAALAAAQPVALTSTVFVERTVPGGEGRTRMVLEQPARMSRGDRLVFLVDYRSTSARNPGELVVTNPLPATVAYQGTSGRAALVSIDGGRNWGTLDRLRITERDGTVRNARPEDVTHVRWMLDPAASPSGRLIFRGVVR